MSMGCKSLGQMFLPAGFHHHKQAFIKDVETNLHFIILSFHLTSFGTFVHLPLTCTKTQVDKATFENIKSKRGEAVLTFFTMPLDDSQFSLH